MAGLDNISDLATISRNGSLQQIMICGTSREQKTKEVFDACPDRGVKAKNC